MKNRNIDWEKVGNGGNAVLRVVEELFKALLMVFGFMFFLMLDTKPRYHRYSRGRRKWW